MVALREVVSYLHDHPSQPVLVERVVRVTGQPELRVIAVFKALADSYVIDCDGDPCRHACRFEPDLVLNLEVERFLRVAEGSNARLQRGVDRFRSRYDSGN